MSSGISHLFSSESIVSKLNHIQPMVHVGWFSSLIVSTGLNHLRHRPYHVSLWHLVVLTRVPRHVLVLEIPPFASLASTGVCVVWCEFNQEWFLNVSVEKGGSMTPNVMSGLTGVWPLTS